MRANVIFLSFYGCRSVQRARAHESKNHPAMKGCCESCVEKDKVSASRCLLRGRVRGWVHCCARRLLTLRFCKELDEYRALLIQGKAALDDALERMEASERAHRKAEQEGQWLQAELMQTNTSMAKQLREATERTRQWQPERERLEALVRDQASQLSARKTEASVLRDEVFPPLERLLAKVDALSERVVHMDVRLERALTQAEPNARLEKRSAAISDPRNRRKGNGSIHNGNGKGEH